MRNAEQRNTEPYFRNRCVCLRMIFDRRPVDHACAQDQWDIEDANINVVRKTAWLTLRTDADHQSQEFQGQACSHSSAAKARTCPEHAERTCLSC